MLGWIDLPAGATFHGTVLHMRKRGSYEPMPDFLRDAMAAAGLSAAELARRSGASESQISRWLAGAHRPDINQLRTVAPALGVRILDLVVAAGHLTAEEAGLEGPPMIPEPPVWSRDAIIDLIRGEFARTDAEALVRQMRLFWGEMDAVAGGQQPEVKMSRAVRKGIADGRRRMAQEFPEEPTA